MLIRPEDIVITDAEDVPLKGVVRSVIFKGCSL